MIAEIGINHNNSIRLAKKLIDLAKNSGFEAIILLQPTTPFRSIVTFKKLLKIFLKDPSKPVISIKKLI